jgi:hypothetical protein
MLGLFWTTKPLERGALCGDKSCGGHEDGYDILEALLDIGTACWTSDYRLVICFFRIAWYTGWLQEMAETNDMSIDNNRALKPKEDDIASGRTTHSSTDVEKTAIDPPTTKSSDIPPEEGLKGWLCVVGAFMATFSTFGFFNA